MEGGGFQTEKYSALVIRQVVLDRQISGGEMCPLNLCRLSLWSGTEQKLQLGPILLKDV